MIDEEGARNLFNHIFKLWINPEIQHRRKNGTLPKEFKILRCLIKLPKDRSPIIEFNDEIGWVASVKIAPGASFEKGQRVHLHEIQRIAAVAPPEVNGQRVAFVYLFLSGHEYHILFDFTPNVPGGLISKEEREDWKLSKVIAESLQAVLIEKTIRIHDSMQAQLQKIGLWAAPALLPYPISKILKRLAEGNRDGARAAFLAYCTPNFIEKVSYKWWTIEQFEERKRLIQGAIGAHKEEKYELSIHALLPHIEGIITDWVYTKLPEEEIPWRQVSKTKKFRDLVLNEPPTTFTYQRIVESTINFIVSGPVLKTFKRWVDQIDQAFPGRHVVEHGRYDASLFSEENSAKLFLLLDTLYYLISSRSEPEDT